MRLKLTVLMCAFDENDVSFVELDCTIYEKDSILC